MVKNLLNLNNEEKKLSLEFLCRNNKNQSLEDIEKNLMGKIYHYGKGVLFYFKEGTVLGTASVVLEVCEKLKTTYIHAIDILEKAEFKNEILSKLIYEGKKVSYEYNATKILLGIRNKEILNIAKDLGLSHSYCSYKMELKSKEVQEQLLDLIPLTKENKYDYLAIYNSSFSDMPHGTYITKEDVNDFLENPDKNTERFIVASNGVYIGFMDTSIEGDKGFFDIGLSKENRGAGYGKRLLETAINRLNYKKIPHICLTVIEKNTIAFNMYKKRGFEVYNLLSNWIEL
ncbi:GNAT family N-acetyltransferase [Clostridium sp.]|uniref:GNAT family N-acetyltransferase n=1 Tax=Clostridium sp. TaxID=1506 RepID=UPI003F2F8BFE